MAVQRSSRPSRCRQGQEDDGETALLGAFFTLLTLAILCHVFLMLWWNALAEASRFIYVPETGESIQPQVRDDGRQFFGSISPGLLSLALGGWSLLAAGRAFPLRSGRWYLLPMAAAILILGVGLAVEILILANLGSVSEIEAFASASLNWGGVLVMGWVGLMFACAPWKLTSIWSLARATFLALVIILGIWIGLVIFFLPR